MATPQEKGKEYERLVAEYLSNQGFIVWITGSYDKAGDEGIDLVAFNPQSNTTCFVQCKNIKNKEYYITKSNIDYYINKYDEHKKYKLKYPKNHKIAYIIVVDGFCMEKDVYVYAISKGFEIITLKVSEDGRCVEPIKPKAKETSQDCNKQG